MSKPKFMNDAERKNEIVKSIESIAYKTGQRVHNVFSDWVEMMAIAFSNRIDLAKFDERENRYLAIAKKYNKAQLEGISELLTKLVLCFNPYEDVVNYDDYLGSIYMGLNLGNAHRGQFFTPYSVSTLMAKISGGSKEDYLRRDITLLSEPTSGAGGMVIAFAENLRDIGVNYSRHLYVRAQDIDPLCVYMTYVQCTLLHIPAIVVLGNSLTDEVRDSWITPAYILGDFSERMRFNSMFERFKKILMLSAESEDKPNEISNSDLADSPVLVVENGAIRQIKASDQLTLF